MLLSKLNLYSLIRKGLSSLQASVRIIKKAQKRLEGVQLLRKSYSSYFLSPLALCLLITAFFFFDRSVDVQAGSTGELIVNGDFSDEFEGWDGSFTPPETAPVFDEPSESAYLEDSTLFQSLIAVPNHAIYEFSFDCRGTGTENNLIYALHNYDLQVGTPVYEMSCQADSQVEHRLSLVPGSYELNYIGKDVYIDNVSLTFATAYENIDTGLIVNGDFIGTDGWQSLVDGEPIQLIAYEGATEVGALTSGAKQQNISIKTPGKYLFSFVCKENVETPAEYIFSLKIAGNGFEYFQSYECTQPIQQFELMLPIVSDDYELILLAPSNRDGFEAWADDVSLVLLDEIMPEPTLTATETAVPTATETVMPTATETAVPTATETLMPTATETAVPTASATMTAEPTGTAEPTVAPTATVTAEATRTQTATPTATVINPLVTPDPAASDLNLFIPIIRLDE